MSEQERVKSDDGAAACPLRILLADDTPASRNLLAGMLEQRGHEIVVAANGQEAVDRFSAGRFDVVLLDIRMPVMDGIETARAIRQTEQRRGGNVRIVAITAETTPEDFDRCLEAGMNAWLPKPITVAKLIEAVEQPATSLKPSREPNGHAPGTGRPPEKPVVDFQGALRRLGGDVSLLRQFVAVFDEDSPRLLENVRGAMADGDGERVGTAAHSLKGLAANFGAARVVRAAKQAEEAACSGRRDEIDSLVATLESEVERLSEALEEYRQCPSP